MMDLWIGEFSLISKLNLGTRKKLIYFKSIIFILIFGVFLPFELNAECEVKGYYRANGTWVDGYTKSGECWQGDVIGYDAEGRTSKEREDIKIESNRKKMPFLLVIVGLLALFRYKSKEGSHLRIFINIFFFPLFIYFVFIVASDLVLIFILIVSYIIWEIILDRKKKKFKEISETHLSTTVISDSHSKKKSLLLLRLIIFG